MITRTGTEGFHINENARVVNVYKIIMIIGMTKSKQKLNVFAANIVTPTTFDVELS